jgi:hypothetical protein
MEKFSSFERVVGKASENEKKGILKEKDAQFNNQYFEELTDKEREKTPKELQIINLANQCTNEIRKKYGLSSFDIPSKNIHIIKKDKWPKEESAFYSSMMQAMALREQSAGVVFMKKVVHEMLHFKSYNALQVMDNDIGEYRVGLTVSTRDGENMYFRNFNEAVVEEMTKNILAKFAGNPLFVEEVNQTNGIINRNYDAKMSNGENLFDRDTFYAEMENGSNKINTESFTKEKERKILSILIDKLFERNKEIFKSREDIFEMFSRAMMTGNIIPAGKLIDNTFGVGIFRKIGELDEKINEQEKFVHSL